MTLWDLIDTQWNVNTDSADVMAENIGDLIDTQWNVNKKFVLFLTLNS